jgi:hypothetical protein
MTNFDYLLNTKVVACSTQMSLEHLFDISAIVVLVDYFMCMVVLVLRIAYGQVVLLQTMLNFVA